MKGCKLILMVFLSSTFSVLKSQNIKPVDLRGEWTMDIDKGKNTLYLNFISDSMYKYRSDKDNAIRNDYYSLSAHKNETTLTLDSWSGTYFGSRKIYLIRKINPVSFNLQITETNKQGEIISYKWQKVNKTNTFYLYRWERHQTITN
jgi:hypothetical protein